MYTYTYMLAQAIHPLPHLSGAVGESQQWRLRRSGDLAMAVGGAEKPTFLVAHGDALGPWIEKNKGWCSCNQKISKTWKIMSSELDLGMIIILLPFYTGISGTTFTQQGLHGRSQRAGKGAGGWTGGTWKPRVGGGLLVVRVDVNRSKDRTLFGRFFEHDNIDISNQKL